MTAATLDLENQVLEGDALDEALQGCELHPNGMPVVQSRDCVFQKLDTKEMSADFTIVTRGSQLNRHGNKVQIVGGGQGDGIQLVNYKTNPQVLFQHGFAPQVPYPIGQSAPRGTEDCTVKLFQQKADAKVFFSQVFAEAALIFALVEEGQLRTASVGFIPLKAMMIKQKPPKDEEGPHGEPIWDLARPWVALDFLSCDLIEWSIVDIPADAGALRKHLELGHIRGEKITDRFRPVLRQMAGDKKLVVPGVGAGQVAPFVIRESVGDYRFEAQAPTFDGLRQLLDDHKQRREPLDARNTPGITQQSAGSEQEAPKTPAGDAAIQTESETQANAPAGVLVSSAPEPPQTQEITAELVQGVLTQCLRQEIGKLEASQTELEQTLALRTGKVI